MLDFLHLAKTFASLIEMFFKKRILLFLLFCALGFAAAVKAERLPLRLYTSADGLASGAVFHILKDSRGFLWFSTRDGLSRYDGREFVNFRLEEGETPIVNATYETRDGTFWISASGGLYRIKPNLTEPIKAEEESRSTGLYKTFKAERVTKTVTAPPFLEDSQGRLWGAGVQPFLISENGELRLRQFDLGEIAFSERGAAVAAIYETADRSVWFGGDLGALRLLPDGRRILYPIKRETTYDGTNSIISDENGRIWVSHRSGVYVFQPDSLDSLAETPDLSVRQLVLEEKTIENPGQISLPDSAGKILRLNFADKQASPSNSSNTKTSNIGRIFKTFDNQIWIPTGGNLFVFERGAFRLLSDTNSFPSSATNFVEDDENNVWMATEGGVFKFNRGGLTTWGLAEGLRDPRVHSFSVARNGELFVVHGDWRISHLIENKVETVQLNLPEGKRILWTSPAALLDSSNRWWALTSGGLFRFAGAGNLSSLNNQKPEQSFATNDGFKSDSFYSAFEDSAGNVWISTRGTTEQLGLARLDAKTNQWRFFSEADNLPKNQAFRSFAEDHEGNLWIGFYGNGFTRFSNDRFTDFSNVEGAPKGSILAIHVDTKGRLWLGSTQDGLILVENPGAENPVFKKFTDADGLASNNVRSLTSDLAGNIYVGTVRGIDRFNPETGSVRHYSTPDGLPSDSVNAAFRDLSGALWFGTFNGLSRLDPINNAILKPSSLRVLINSLQIAGKDYSVSEFGHEAIENLRLSAAENNLRIQFLSVGNGLRYQYKLEGDGDKDWSQPSAERTVNFAGLAPGTYKFLVRAVDSDNRASEKPALVTFTIAPPFWKSWQFIGAIFLLAALSIFLLDRYRVAKTRQVQTALSRSLESEKIARESETRFRTLAQTASDAIITIDTESRIVFVNDAVEKIFGFAANELVGENLTIVMPDKFHDKHFSGLNRYVSSNRKNIPWTGIELPGRHKSGKEIPLEVSFGEFTLDGKRYFTGVARDVSERKRAEEAIQKAREDRLKELQKVRTRIATDLHDDIGSSLTQIAVLSEVARSLAVREEVKTPLERISDVSNELVDAMADIVWAINPKKDSWRELVLRMRRFASDVLSSRDIEFEFETPETEINLQLGANIRREVFSIFKECVNNIVRHSGASEVLIEFEIIVGVLRLKIADNGRGFDAAKILNDDFSPEKGGNGLINIRRRVSDLSGTCEIKSSGAGTVIELFIPLQKEHESVSLAIHVDSDGANGNGIH